MNSSGSSAIVKGTSYCDYWRYYCIFSAIVRDTPLIATIAVNFVLLPQ